MSRFKDMATGRPATWENVTQAVARLSTLDETQLQELASSGEFTALFPYHMPPAQMPADVMREEDMVEAQPRALTRAERLAIDQGSHRNRSSKEKLFGRKFKLKTRSSSGSGSSSA